MNPLLDTVEHITQERLKELLHYDQESGDFTWKVTRRVKAGDKAGCLLDTGYVTIGADGKSYLAHRLAWLYVYGSLPEYVDHINRIRHDNRISNLRQVTNSQNNANRVESRKAASGFQGVMKLRNCNRFKPQIMVNNKHINLGSHATAEDAYKVYLAARKKYFGEFDILSMPEPEDELRRMAEGEKTE